MVLTHSVDDQSEADGPGQRGRCSLQGPADEEHGDVLGEAEEDGGAGEENEADEHGDPTVLDAVGEIAPYCYEFVSAVD